MSNNKSNQPTNTARKGKGSSDKEEQVTAAAVSSAMEVLTKMAIEGGPDESIPEDDIVIDFALTLRVGSGEPFKVSGQRRLQAALVCPDISSAVQECEVVLRQIVHPVGKMVNRTVSARMRELGMDPEGTAFDPSRKHLPGPR